MAKRRHDDGRGDARSSGRGGVARERNLGNIEIDEMRQQVRPPA